VSILFKKITLRMLLLLLVVALPIAIYIFIEDDVQLTWNINNIKEINKYTISVEFFSEEEKLSVVENIEYINKNEKSTDKLFFYLNNVLTSNAKLCQDAIEEIENKAQARYKIGCIEYVRIKEKNMDYKIIGKNNSVLMIKLDQRLEKDDKVIIDIKYTTIISHLNKAANEGKASYILASWYPTAIQHDNGWQLETVYKSNELVCGGNYFLVDIIVPESFEVQATGRLIEKLKTKRNQHYKFQDQNISNFYINIISTNK